MIDVFSRRVVGWQFATHMRTDLVLDALRMALLNRNFTAARSDELWVADFCYLRTWEGVVLFVRSGGRIAAGSGVVVRHRAAPLGALDGIARTSAA